MNIKTKFSINDTVYQIGQNRKQVSSDCPACNGSGKYSLPDDVKRTCPACYGRGEKVEFEAEKWAVIGALTIGQVRAKVTNLKKTGDFDNYGEYSEGCDESEFQYMCYETGVDSGSLWGEDRLFESRDVAELECEKLNSEESNK